MPPFLYVFVFVDAGGRPKLTRTLLKPQWDPGAMSGGYIIHKLFSERFRLSSMGAEPMSFHKGYFMNIHARLHPL